MDGNNPNDDLQNDDQGSEQGSLDLNNENLDQRQGAELDPASEPGHDKDSDGGEQKPINQEAVNEAIAKQHAKFREEQRKNQQLEKRLAELESQGADNDPEPEIHKVDEYAADIGEQVRLRDESLRAHMAWEQRQQQREAQRTDYQRNQETQAQQIAQENEQKMYQSAQDLEVSQEDLNKSIATIGQYQLGPEVAQYLMGDDKSVQMIQSLAKNPTMLAELSLMNPSERMLHIERNVRSKLSVKPRTSGAKPPPTRVKGKAPDVSDRYPLTGGKVTVE